MNSNYTRRRFLKTFVVSAGAVGASSLIGCGSSSNGHTGGETVTPELLSFSSIDSGTIFPQSVASGDPKSGSIILWTRISSNSASDQGMAMQLSTDSSFSASAIVTQSALQTSAEHDHCVKVKVTDLDSATTYYYRFIYNNRSTKTGRFKTAALGNVNTPVNFAFVSCQDFTNGYYNTLMKLLDDDVVDDIDFVVHLGDYIYETTGDPSFQGNIRTISFTDTANAVTRTSSTGATFYAAASLSNYRELYQQYRSDEILQRVHEKFAFINIWDDHEFSDDAWQDNGTYFDALVSEQSEDRRKNSEEAFFEYTPMDIDPSTGKAPASGTSTTDRNQVFERIDANTISSSQIHRQLRFGQNLNLIMTDYRSNRPDHIIPEDAFPGTIILDQLEVGKALHQVPGDPFGAKATVDATDGPVTTAVVNGTTVTVWALITSDQEDTLKTHVSNLISAQNLTMLPYVNVESVTNSELTAFLTAFNNTLGALLGAGSYFSNPATDATLQEALIGALTGAYSSSSLEAPLSQGDAQIKAAGIVTGNLDIISINATLTGMYETLLAGLNLQGAGFADVDAMFTALAVQVGQPNLVATLGVSQKQLPDGVSDSFDNGGGVAPDNLAELGALTTDPSWGFGGFGMSWALMGKGGVATSFGSRYLVVKASYDLYNIYRALVEYNTTFHDAWGSAQVLNVFGTLNNSNATWDVVGSSVSFTSMKLDAESAGTLNTTLAGFGVSESDFPRTTYYMNVDHWDGFPLTKATYLGDSSGALAANGFSSFQSSNVVLISGDIHASFVTDHGNTDNNRCIEFTVPAVSSGTLGTFTGDSIASILDLDPDNNAGHAFVVNTLKSELPIYFREAESGIQYAD
ncbi:MAG: alkaline phosphatase D family protein, partial [Proteobacteria bacterium]|nr:alkaline phosphatase D family protein [Pseudomonadota bacterium]